MTTVGGTSSGIVGRALWRIMILRVSRSFFLEYLPVVMRERGGVGDPPDIRRGGR